MIHIQNWENSNKLVLFFFILLLLIFVIVQIKLPIYGDDYEFINSFRNNNTDIISFYKSWCAIGGWSSRFILDFTVFLTTKYNFIWILWQILNPFFIPLFFLSLVNLSLNKTFNNISFYFLLSLIFPYTTVSSAGWAATTISYLWPASLLFICISILLQYQNNPNEVTLLKKIVFFISLIIAIDHELLCLFLTIIVFVNFVYLLKHKEKDLFVFSFSVIVIFRLCIHIVWKVLGGRYLSELYNWFPNFGDLSIFDKIVSGYSNFAYLTFVREPACAFVFSFLLMLITLKVNSSTFNKIVASIPFFVIILFRVIKKISIINFFGTIQWEYGFINFDNYLSIVPYICLFLYCMVFYSITYIIFVIFNLKTAIMIAVIFISSCLTKILMGLSPTVVGSGARTGVLVFMACLFLSALAYNKIYMLTTCDVNKIIKIIRIITLFFALKKIFILFSIH